VLSGYPLGGAEGSLVWPVSGGIKSHFVLTMHAGLDHVQSLGNKMHT
jgi:hypothetical protein